MRSANYCEQTERIVRIPANAGIFYLAKMALILQLGKGLPISSPMNKLILPITACFLICVFNSCEKQDALAPVIKEEPRQQYINFKEDSIFVNLSVTKARKESIGSISTTAIEGRMPDSIGKKYSLIIRVTGDSARSYSLAEVLATYTDSLGFTYSNSIADTLNKVNLVKLEKKRNGLVEGSFTIRVSNSTKTKSLLLKEGKISTTFIE